MQHSKSQPDLTFGGMLRSAISHYVSPATMQLTGQVDLHEHDERNYSLPVGMEAYAKTR
jgi:hypothetical protein